MPKFQTKLTSVIVIDDTYNKFKLKNVDGPINFQKLVNRALDLYINKEEFRKQINDYNQLISKCYKF